MLLLSHYQVLDSPVVIGPAMMGTDGSFALGDFPALNEYRPYAQDRAYLEVNWEATFAAHGLPREQYTSHRIPSAGTHEFQRDAELPTVAGVPNRVTFVEGPVRAPGRHGDVIFMPMSGPLLPSRMYGTTSYFGADEKGLLKELAGRTVVTLFSRIEELRQRIRSKQRFDMTIRDPWSPGVSFVLAFKH